MLAGYTAALIGFPAVAAPGAVWDIALARVEEIGLGIICTTVIGTALFPRALGPMLSARILSWVGNASSWTNEVLGGTDDKTRGGARIRLAADAVKLRMLSSRLAYDTSQFQASRKGCIVVLLRRICCLLLMGYCRGYPYNL
jgi:uncharacterized membrane protein YccC